MTDDNVSEAHRPEANGFVQIHPSTVHHRACPACGQAMTAVDWSIPGQWTLGRYRCGACGLDVWADLPFNLGVLSPCYVDTRTNEVARPCGPDWYAALTRAAWAGRGRRAVRLQRKVRRAARRACLINALGNCWGDAIMTIAKLNAVRDAGELDVVVLTTANLEPHIPEWVAEAWLVDGSHADTAFWNEDLADAVKAEVARFAECYVPIIFQAPSLTRAGVSALSGIEPFDRERWDERLEQAPTVTFMWRDDRCWASAGPAAPVGRIVRRLARSRVGRVARFGADACARIEVREQFQRVLAMAGELRRALPRLDFAVCGQGSFGHFPSWIEDLRRAHADAGANALWCERAARSHLLVGILGSQMVLPSGHAGGVIDLVPPDYLRNVVTDWLITSDDVREAIFLYRMLPSESSPRSVAETAISMLVNYSCARSSLHGSYYRPLHPDTVEALVATQNERARILRTATTGVAGHLIGP